MFMEYTLAMQCQLSRQLHFTKGDCSLIGVALMNPPLICFVTYNMVLHTISHVNLMIKYTC